jgi:hypothetical protein
MFGLLLVQADEATSAAPKKVKPDKKAATTKGMLATNSYLCT